jgi:hypothetical protein
VIHARQRLQVLIESILARHMAAAIDELALALNDELEERARDRVADLRQQIEQGGTENDDD